MKKLVALALVAIFSVSIFAGVTYAQDSSATDSVSKSKAAERTKVRLEKLTEKRASKSATRKNDRSESRRRSHIKGEITAISGTTITLQTKKEEIKTVFTNEETKFIQIQKGGKKDITISDLKVGDRIAAVGIAKDEANGIAKFVVRLDKPDKNKHSVFGEVKKVSGSEITISHIIHKDKPETTVKVTDDTKIKIKGKESASIEDVKVGDKVAASGTVDDKGVIIAKRLFVIPGKASGVKPQEATKSATPSSSN